MDELSPRRPPQGLWPTSERVPAAPLPTQDAWTEGLPPKWNAREREFLMTVRRQCPSLATAPPYPDAYGDRRLLRFLRHHKNRDKALAAVKQYLAWRQESNVDKVRAELDELTNPREWPFGDFLLDRCCMLPCSTELFDTHGNALCVEQYGFWPAHRLRDVSADTYLTWHSYGLEWKSMLLERISMARERFAIEAGHPLEEGWGEIARLCTIFDMAGLTLSHALLPAGVRMVKQLIPLVQKYYPWLQDTTHLVNVSSTIASCWHGVKPLLPAHTQRKIHIHAALSSLSACIRLDHLPRTLGGNADCPDLDPPPTYDDVKSRQDLRHSMPACEKVPEVVIKEPLSPASESDALSPRSRILLDHLDAGGKITVYKHGRRGKAAHYLTCDDTGLRLARRHSWRLSFRKSARILHNKAGIIVAQGGSTTPHADRVHERASCLPDNYVVVGTDDNKLVTLELASSDQAVAVASLASPEKKKRPSSWCGGEPPEKT